MKDEIYKFYLKDSKRRYKNIGKIYCPVLCCTVSFNSQGFRHFTHDGLGKSRSRKDVVRRLGLLFKSMTIIQTVKVVAEQRGGNDKEYWALEMGGIRVILRKIGGGNIHFYSVMDGYN